MTDGDRSWSFGSFWPHLLFLGVAGFLALAAEDGFGFGPDQIAYNLAAQDLIDDWRSGEPLRNEFGTPGRQSFTVLHAFGIALFGNPADSYRLVLFVSALAYLVAMYVLMARFLDHRAIAALVSVVTVVQRYTIGTSFWGMGEFQSILPRIVVLPLFPLAWLLFDRYLTERRVLLAFVLVAVGFGLHLSAVYFYAILLLTYGLWILWKRDSALVSNLLVATIIPVFALVCLPGPMWSRQLETAPLMALLIPVLGGAVLAFHLRTPRRWSVAPVLLFFVTSTALYVEGTGITAHFRKKESAKQASAPQNPAAAPMAAAAVDEPGPRAAQPPPKKARAKTPETANAPRKQADPPPQSKREEEPIPTPPLPPADAPAQAEPNPAVSESARIDLVNEALYARFGWALFPISLATLVFALFNAGLPLATAAYEFGHRWRRRLSDSDKRAALLAVAVVVVSLGLTGALQLYSRITGRPDIVLELFRAFRFVFLPIYLFMGLLLARTWAAWRTRPPVWRAGWALLVLALAIPPRQALAALPDGLKLWARSLAEGSGTLNSGDPSQRKYLLMLLATDAERAEARHRHQDFVELCGWVRESTPESAVFMTTDYDFLHEARREILVSYAQGAGSARSLAKRIGYRGWHEAYTTISSAFASGSAERIMEAARRYEVDYVVVGGGEPELPAERVFANRGYSLYAMPPPAQPPADGGG